MKIKVADLKFFKANASFIKQNGIIPILNYLKFEDGTITKNSLNAFLIQRVNAFKESFLVDEKILMNFLDCTSEPEIEIKLKDNRIVITDGNTNITSPTEKVSTFPTNETDDFEKIELDINVLSSIRIASNFIISEDVMPAKSHVFIGKKTVAASNGFIAYLESFDYELPEIVLSKDTAIGISKFESIKFSQSERYHFFENAVCKFGFIKPDYKFFDLTVFGKFDKEASPKFEINKMDFIRFNDMAISSTPKAKPVASFQIKESKMKIEMQDTDFEIDITKEISVAGEMNGAFSYLPVNMNQLLKNLPDADLTFYQSTGKYYVTGANGFTSLLMEVIPQ